MLVGGSWLTSVTHLLRLRIPLYLSLTEVGGTPRYRYGRSYVGPSVTPVRHIPRAGDSERRKVTMTEKQLGNSVRHGRKITFARQDAEPITGYLAGLDHDSFLVLCPETKGVRQHLLNRHATPWQEIHPESTLAEEQHCAALEEVLKPFRKWVCENLLQMDPPKKR